jgi:hypothetical protein
MGSLRRDVLGRTACRSWSTAWSLGRTSTGQPAMRQWLARAHATTAPALPTVSYAMPCVSWGNTVHRVVEGGGVNGRRWVHTAESTTWTPSAPRARASSRASSASLLGQRRLRRQHGASQGCPQRLRGCFRRPERRGMLSAAPARSMVRPVGPGAMACAGAMLLWRVNPRTLWLLAARLSGTFETGLGIGAGVAERQEHEGRTGRAEGGPATPPARAVCPGRCARAAVLRWPCGIVPAG